jgi:hypothetical protein
LIPIISDRPCIYAGHKIIRDKITCCAKLRIIPEKELFTRIKVDSRSKDRGNDRGRVSFLKFLIRNPGVEVTKSIIFKH